MSKNTIKKKREKTKKRGQDYSERINENIRVMKRSVIKK